MAELSPAAKAVLDAMYEINLDFLEENAKLAAAALRAAADQVQMREPFGNTDADAGVFAAHQAIHAYLLTIAAELES